MLYSAKYEDKLPGEIVQSEFKEVKISAGMYCGLVPEMPNEKF